MRNMTLWLKYLPSPPSHYSEDFFNRHLAWFMHSSYSWLAPFYPPPDRLSSVPCYDSRTLTERVS